MTFPHEIGTFFLMSKLVAPPRTCTGCIVRFAISYHYHFLTPYVAAVLPLVPVPLCVSTLSLYYYVIPVQKHIPLFKICNCIFVLSLLFAEIRTKQRSGCVLTSIDV